MGMDQVNRVGAVQFPNGRNNSREDKCARSRKSDPSGQRKIAKPLGARISRAPTNARSIKGLDRKNGIAYSRLRKCFQRFRDEASRRLILLAGIKRRECEEVKRPARLTV